VHLRLRTSNAPQKLQRKSNDMPNKKLTARQEATLAKHKQHHSAKHMAEMRKEMRAGATFSAAHKRAQKKVGK
jgi:hypothetical protein